MNTRRPRYHRHRFPPEIISHAVWLYHRYCMSFRDVEDLLAERGIIVSYETVRQWCGKFGPDYARQLKRRQGRLGDTWFLDEVFVTINGQRQYLWRAVDQDGDLIDILVQPRRDGRAARRFFRRLLKSQRQEPVRLVTDKTSVTTSSASCASTCPRSWRTCTQSPTCAIQTRFGVTAPQAPRGGRVISRGSRAPCTAPCVSGPGPRPCGPVGSGARAS